MENKTDYLNLIDRIGVPTTEDIFDFFRILTLLLQGEADKGRWRDLKAENFTAYDNSSFYNTELGSKIEYRYPHFKYEAGYRFKLCESTGYFSLFFILYPLWEKAAKCIISKGIDELGSDIYYDCGICKERVICSSIYQATKRIISYIEAKYPKLTIINDEMEEPIGMEIMLTGSCEDIFIQTCKYLDIIIPIVIKEKPVFVTKRAETLISFTPTKLYDAFQPSIFSSAPYFKIFERDSKTIEEIYNKSHGINGEYQDEEAPF